MKTTYVFRNGQFVNKGTGEPMEMPGDEIATPYIASDIAPYMSIASGKMVDGRSARREDLKRTGCREVDPSEWNPEGCRTEKWAKRLNKPFIPDKPVERLKTSIGPVEV